jgi:TolB-like protein
MGVISMPDPRERPTVNPAAALPEDHAPEGALAELKESKKKDKVRAAWISFVGRIVAQVVGAAVTVALTLFVVQRAQQAGPREVPPVPAQAVAETATRPAAEKTTGAPPGAPDLPAEVAVAVLPLQNYSGDPGQDSFADGMTEALIAELAHLKGLKVTSRTSSMRYRGSRQALPEIARELGVTHVIEGSVARDKAHVRVTAQVIDAATDRHVWAQSYDRREPDALGIQADVAAAIARDVGQLGLVAGLDVDAVLEPVRTDPRFTAPVERLRF